jgi:hypothetical protein
VPSPGGIICALPDFLVNLWCLFCLQGLDTQCVRIFIIMAELTSGFVAGIIAAALLIGMFRMSVLMIVD